MSELITDTEQVFACEAAADSYRASGYVYDQKQIRTAFLAGWEAAMKYVEQRRREWALESLKLEKAARDE